MSETIGTVEKCQIVRFIITIRVIHFVEYGKTAIFPFFVVSNGRNVFPSTIWGTLTTKTDYLITLLAFLILHPASHGKSGRCVTLRQIKIEQMFLHHFVCSVHFPTVQKHTGIETIPHFYWKNDKGFKSANGIQPAFCGDFVMYSGIFRRRASS